MTDNNCESSGQNAQSNAAKPGEGGSTQFPSREATETKGGGDDKSRALGGKPGLGEYGRPNKAENAGE